jgi:hypothetical protein
MSKMKDLWLDENEPIEEYEKPEYAQAGITRETMERMKSWLEKIAEKND